MHLTNIAERCCYTWKNHFTFMRAGASTYFCMANWCRMTEQCNITLNMMRSCTLNLHLSTFEATKGMYLFDATPMASVGTNSLIHVTPVQRHMWCYHALKAWYITPSLKYYRVIKGVTEAGAMRQTDTWKFKHHTIKTPTITLVDRIIATAIQFHGNKPQNRKLITCGHSSWTTARQSADKT